MGKSEIDVIKKISEIPSGSPSSELIVGELSLISKEKLVILIDNDEEMEVSPRDISRVFIVEKTTTINELSAIWELSEVSKLKPGQTVAVLIKE